MIHQHYQQHGGCFAFHARRTPTVTYYISIIHRVQHVRRYEHGRSSELSPIARPTNRKRKQDHAEMIQRARAATAGKTSKLLPRRSTKGLPVYEAYVTSGLTISEKYEDIRKEKT